MRSWILALATVAAGAAVVAAYRFVGRGSAETLGTAAAPGAAPGVESAPSVTSARTGLPSAPPMPSSMRWLAVGGGVDPVSNQVSIEQDLGLAAEVLGDGGALLFAGGAKSSPVQVLADPPHTLSQRLGALFDPRDGRVSHYRPTLLSAHRPATPAVFLETLSIALAAADDRPLLLFVAAHGEAGQEPSSNLVRLWGGGAVTVDELARALERPEPSRPLRLVMASCFSGGFAELAFARGDRSQGPTTSDRCGLFAATWDREASGCDPNPDRRAQESYGLHFLNALRGADRLGKPLPRAEIDGDGDGRISLLEAHTRVRVASRSFSVPTTTSERWLREVAPKAGPSKAVALPDERAVIRALGDRLSITEARAARNRLAALEERVGSADEAAEVKQRELDAAWAALRIALLERWPVIDDPYHPDYAATLERDRAAIETALSDWSEAQSYHAAQAEADKAEAQANDLDLESAMVERLTRAFDNVELAGRLAAKGGAPFEQYLRLLSCERSVPTLR